MEYIPRRLETKVKQALGRGRSVLLFGARQTGKTTLVSRFKADLTISLVPPEIRQRYEKAPQLLRGEVEALAGGGLREMPLVVLGEVQKVPMLLDAVQDLIDRKVAQFLLTGSSARKLRRSAAVNLLPGRVSVFKLDPLSLAEVSGQDLSESLFYGSLPGMLKTVSLSDRESDLESYVTTYLEQEIRAEAVVRNVGDFARFLELAASQSGEVINLRKLSQEIGVAHATIGAYYQILEDCLITERIEPLTQSKTRKKLVKSEKYLFFDLGVRRLAAHEGTRPPRETWGRLFEQWVGLELVRGARLGSQARKLRFWRDPDGPEVDWVIDREGEYVPIEVKWTESPTLADARHLQLFLSEYPTAPVAYVVCRVPRRTKLADRIFAIPWQALTDAL